MDHEDLAVIDAVIAGDTEAFRHLVDRHKDRLFAVLMRLVGDESLAAELVQDTFVKAFHGLGGFRRDASFGTWLVQIGIHAARDHARRMGRHYQRITVSLEDVRGPDGLPEEIAERGPDPSRGVESREEGELLRRAIGDLPPEYRELIVLRHFDEVPYEEIAAMTGLTVGSLKVRAHRARKMLKERLLVYGWDGTRAPGLGKGTK